MKRFIWALIACGTFVPNAQAVILLEDNFDSYTDTASFVSSWKRYNCMSSAACTGGPHTVDATIATDLNVSAPNSVHFPSAPDTANSPRHQRSFTNTGVGPTDKLVFSYDFYDAITGNPQRNFANLNDQFNDSGAEFGPSGNNQLISMGLNNNQLANVSGGNYYMARIVGYNLTAPATDPDGGPNEEGTLGTAPFFKLNDFANSPTRSIGWHNLKVELTRNPTAGMDYNFYVDGIHAERVTGVGTTFRNYDTVTIGSGFSNGSATANFENVRVELNPPAVITGDGDFNGDLTVDAADYIHWRDNNPLATGATKLTGDSDIDGDNDNTDYANWKGTFGNVITPPGSGAGFSAVPEPTPLFLVLAMVGMIAAGRRR